MLYPVVWDPSMRSLLQWSEFVIDHFKLARNNSMHEPLFRHVIYCYDPFSVSRRSVELEILMCFSQSPNRWLEGDHFGLLNTKSRKVSLLDRASQSCFG